MSATSQELESHQHSICRCIIGIYWCER